MEFAPHESFFVIFPCKDSEQAAITDTGNFPKAIPVTTLKGSWQVSFDPNWGGPEKVTFDKLCDWSESKDNGIKYYSGIATYRKTFDLPQVSGLRSQISDKRVYLDLGKLHEMARVRLNGEDLGVVWCAPWRIDVSDAVKAGNNDLEIEVANLWPNRLIGDAAKPEAKQFTWTIQGHPYNAKSELLPSGLLGPVRLITFSKRELF